jgi:hypothetical protein
VQHLQDALATLMLAGDRRPLARGQRTDHAAADPRSEPLIYHGGHLALVSELKRLAAIVETFLIAGTGSADGAPARHRGRRKPGSDTGRWRARVGLSGATGIMFEPCQDRDWNP